MEINNVLMKSYYHRLVFAVGSLFLIFYFYNLTRSNNNHILPNDVIEPAKDDSSVILDTLLKEQENLNNLPIHTLVSAYKNGIFIYNMEELVESWWTFECIETKMKNLVNTKLCLHETKFDTQISGQLRDNGLWEPTNVRSFVKQLEEVPDANVIDIGANIGLYSLVAAKMKRYVIAVEPLHENLNRIHKAANLENVQSQIIALVNAISNKRDEVQVSIIDFNMGGAYIKQPDLINLLDNKMPYEQISSSVIVNSITVDDLCDVYSDKILNKTTPEEPISNKFVIKIDIEGYEPYAFEKSRELFKKFQVVAIFLEFGKTLENLKKIDYNKESKYLRKTGNMLRMLQDLKFEPYEPNGINKLDYKEWKDWPWDIYFRNCVYVNCPGHEYKATGVRL